MDEFVHLAQSDVLAGKGLAQPDFGAAMFAEFALVAGDRPPFFLPDSGLLREHAGKQRLFEYHVVGFPQRASGTRSQELIAGVYEARLIGINYVAYRTLSGLRWSLH